MTTTRTLMTEDELLRMPDDGFRYELIEGELRQMSPTGFDHGNCTGKLHILLGAHVLKHKLGFVLAAETGFVIARTEDGRATVRAPDVAFVARGRVPADADTSKFLELAPDLIAETLSPSDTAVEVEEKIASWLAAGVRRALVVNPASRSVTVYRSPADISRLTDADELDLGDVIDGFRCRVSEIFD
ncbi:MAG: Uma2 family endonuclease [Acidobacteria bacterium]|nr:Uma2 family endonuclease [Acidobacteriota bacterium]MCA1642896.1 Uma2 family endonuclease [Acidobacteriota bacterium]